MIISLTNNKFEQLSNSQIHYCFYEYLINRLELGTDKCWVKFETLLRMSVLQCQLMKTFFGEGNYWS